MNSLQIEKVLSKNPYTRRLFKGVFAADTLRKFNEYPYCLVVNSDKQMEKGTHWLGLYIPKSDTIEYFDSLASGTVKPEIKKFLDTFNHVKMNKKRVQSVYDTSCGHHVIYFLVHRCKGFSYDSTIRKLNSMGPLSDYRVKLFVFHLIAGSK